jgi:hypothetical protein
VQVINLVAKDTIEEGMLGKLRFKTAMFEGVLDNGEDTIFLGNETKFTAMMDTLGEVLDENTPAESPEIEHTEADEPEPLKEEAKPADTKADNKETSNSGLTEKADTPKVPRQPQELVAQGISFLSGLAQTLQSPEATQQLVDTLVETNAETGESHLCIPVPDKQTVQTLLNFVGKLFNNK